MLLPLGGVPVLARSVRTVLDVEGIQRIVLVVRPQDREAVQEAVAPHLGAHDLWVVDGGEQRHDSERQALEALAGDIESDEMDVVAIHDAARPLATADLWAAVLSAADEHGGAIPVVGRRGSRTATAAPRAPGWSPCRRPRRSGRAPCSTPTAGRTPTGSSAPTRPRAWSGTPRSPSSGVPSSATNLKVTFPEDLDLAERLLSARFTSGSS